MVLTICPLPFGDDLGGSQVELDQDVGELSQRQRRRRRRVPHQVDEAHGSLHRHDGALRIGAPHPLGHGHDLAAQHGVESRHEVRQQRLGQLGVLLDDVDVGRTGRAARQLDLQAEDADQGLGQSCHGVARHPGQLQRGLVAKQVVVGPGEQPDAGRLVGRRREVRIRRQPGRGHEALRRRPIEARRGRHLPQGERSPRAQGQVERQLPEVRAPAPLLRGWRPGSRRSGSARGDRRRPAHRGHAGRGAPGRLSRCNGSWAMAPACPTRPGGAARRCR